MSIIDRGRISDGFMSLEGGMDSGRSPSIIQPNQCAYAGNVTFRGGFARTRPSFKKIVISGSALATLSASKFQGAFYYDNGAKGQILIVASAKLYLLVPPVTGHLWILTDVTGGLAISALPDRVHAVQADTYLVIQDGASAPIIWDGSIARASNLAQDEVPIGTGPMAYGHGRLWVAQGARFVAGDILGGTTGVLKFTENTYLAGGGAFSVPLASGPVTAMRFVAAPNTSLGQGELVVATDDAVFTVTAPLDRESWPDSTNPIQRVVLVNNGAVGHHSSELVNGDFYMRSRDGIRSVVQAVRDFQQAGNTVISQEVWRILKYDDAIYLKYTSGVLFDNRYLLTSQANSIAGTSIAFRGLVALDFSPMSTMRGRSAPSYDGYWKMKIARTANVSMDFYMLTKGRFSGLERCFAFMRGELNKLEMWELLPDGSGTGDVDVVPDGGETISRIESEVETASYSFQSPASAKALTSADLWTDSLSGRVDFHVDFHPDQYPCWVSWQDWFVISEAASSDCESLVDYQRQYRPRMRIGMPSTAEEPATGKMFNIGWEFSARLKWLGHARVKLFRLNAREMDEEPYSDIVLDSSAKSIACDCSSSGSQVEFFGETPIVDTP